MLATNLYAVIDAASEPDTLTMFAELDPVSSCLYLEPLEPDIVHLAPYLVQVDENVQQWLKQRKTHWGFYCESKASFKEVRHHWRKYLQVMLPGRDKPSFFRFYDPRNLWLACEILTDWELHGFLGPVETLMTCIDGEVRREDFKERRQSFPKDSFPRRQIMKISDEQFARINEVFKRQYIDKLSQNMQSWAGIYNSDKDYQPFALALFDYLKERDIDTKYHIESIAELLIKQNVSSLSAIPTDIAEKLANDGSPGWYRANVVIQEKANQGGNNGW